MAVSDARGCTDCSGTMQKIKLIDKGHGNSQLPLEYAAIDAQATFWRPIPVAGSVESFVCSACGLIKLYAAPHG